MEYPAQPKEITFRNGETKQVYVCDKCRRYAEHLGYQMRITKCRYCDFQFEEEGHLVYLESYGKIQFAGFREYRMKLIGHALENHPEHFKKK